MKNNKLVKSSLMVACAVFMNGCATQLLENMSGAKPLKSTKTETKIVFSDEIISYGIPATAIKNHEYAIAMAGQKYSYLIEPTAQTKKTLFHDFFNHLDTKHLAFTTVNAIDPSQAKSLEKMSFEINGQKIEQVLRFVFIKPSAEIKADELKRLEKYQFECQSKLIEQKSYLVCNQEINIELTVATKARNTDQLAQKFRSPLVFDFYQLSTSNSYNVKKTLLLPLYPIAIVYDIVSVPVLLGLGAIGIEGPGDVWFEALF